MKSKQHFFNYRKGKGRTIGFLFFVCIFLSAFSFSKEKIYAYNADMVYKTTITLYSNVNCPLWICSYKDHKDDNPKEPGYVNDWYGWVCTTTDGYEEAQSISWTGWSWSEDARTYVATLYINAYVNNDTPYVYYNKYNPGNQYTWNATNPVTFDTALGSFYYQPAGNILSGEYVCFEIGANCKKSGVSTITLNWNVKDYTVTQKHYKYNVSNKSYEYQKSDDKKVTKPYDSYFDNTTSKTYGGYHLEKADPKDAKIRITGDKTCKYYYDPNSYTVKYNEPKYT